MNEFETPVLVIVDGYSSGSQLPGLMKDLDWKCIHVSSLLNPPSYYLDSYRQTDYDASFKHNDNFEELVVELNKFNVKAVLPGTESGVILADKLAEALKLIGNPTSTSTARRNKYEMHNAVKAAGLRSADHILTNSFEELLAWAQQGAWPVVMKPPASAGTDSVIFCKDPEELKATFGRLLGSMNQLGERNDSVLVQRLLIGQEYFVNGISGKGKHVITEVWRTDKVKIPGAGLIYDRSVLFDPEDPQVSQITDYVCEVLCALGVTYGANHTEIMVTKDGPVLIESASRLSGGLNRPAANHAVIGSQLDLVAKLVTQGEEFIEELSSSKQGLRSPLWQVQFIAKKSGRVLETKTDELVSKLESKTWIQRAPKAGDTLERTVDLFSSPGIIFMSHQDTDVLQKDYDTIRSWEEQNKLFVVESELITE